MTARVFINDVFVCTVPIKTVDGMLAALISKGIYNVHVIEEKKQ